MVSHVSVYITKGNSPRPPLSNTKHLLYHSRGQDPSQPNSLSNFIYNLGDRKIFSELYIKVIVFPLWFQP